MYSKRFFYSSTPQSQPHSQFSVCMYACDAEGNIDIKDGVNADLKMPMASTVKVALALALIKQLYEKKLCLDTTYTLHNDDIIAGMPTSFLDKFFFSSEETNVEVTLQEMLINMIKVSDNTSTDYILKLVGGPDVVNEIITEELGVQNFKCTSTIRELLSNYYQFNCLKTPENIESAKKILQTAFVMRETEKTFFMEKNNSCSTKAMVELLHKIVFPTQKDSPQWLVSGASILLEKMMLCETNSARLRQGVSMSNEAKHVQFCAGKTGNLGSISSELGVVKIREEKEYYYLISISVVYRAQLWIRGIN